MTLREWIPQWLEAYKLGTIKVHSYHQLELLVRHFPDTLLDTELDEIKPIPTGLYISNVYKYECT